MRTVNFADGFVSTSPPDVEGIAQENYNILNNQVNATLFTVDASEYKSVFIDFELTRSDVSNSYLQTGSIVLFYNGTSWDYSTLLTQNDDILAASLALPKDVVLSMVTASGVGTLRYSSGNMGASYLGKIRMVVSKVKVI